MIEYSSARWIISGKNIAYALGEPGPTEFSSIIAETVIRKSIAEEEMELVSHIAEEVELHSIIDYELQ